MPGKRDNLEKLEVQEYNIRGNLFRVWRDAKGRIVFLLDETQNEDKPNVLLVLHPVEDRKWDDILANDYGIDLETIRPRKDNKYQKLDIEYDGLDVYELLIDAYEKNQDISNLLGGLLDYRYAVSHRSAVARLNAATDTVSQSKDTIAKAQNTVKELRDNQRELKAKLAAQKKEIGREPTKESAAKILKTESRIEDNNQRIKRAEKRLAKAERRLKNAQAEIERIRELLARPRPTPGDDDSANVTEIKEKIEIAPMVKKAPTKTIKTTVVETTETKTEKEMADEEIKPLMDQDPEIVNEDNAFKPVAFDDIVVKEDSSKEEKQPQETVTTTETTETKIEEDDYMKRFIDEEINRRKVLEEEPVAKPLDLSPVKEEITEVTETTEETPVLETITSVETPVGADVDTTGEVKVGQYDAAAEPAAPRPVPASPVNRPTRPISPLSGNGYAASSVPPQKNNKLYYLLLVILIVLSVFTLWLFQRKNGATVPEIKDSVTTVVQQEEEPAIDIDTKSDIEEPVEEPEVTPEPEPEPVPEPEPEPVPEPEPEPEPVPEPVPDENQFVGSVQSHDVIFQQDTGGPNVIAPDVTSPSIIAPEPVVVPGSTVIETETETYTEHISASNSQDVAKRMMGEGGVLNPTVVAPTPETIVVPDEPADVPVAETETLVVPEPTQVVVPQPQVVPQPAFMVEPQYIPEPRFVAPPRYNNPPAPRYNNPKRNVDVHDGGQYTLIYDD